jgi:hypothetical protein
MKSWALAGFFGFFAVGMMVPFFLQARPTERSFLVFTAVAIGMGAVLGLGLNYQTRKMIQPGRPRAMPEYARRSTGRPVLAVFLVLGGAAGLLTSFLMDPRQIAPTVYFLVPGWWAGMGLGGAASAVWLRRAERAQSRSFWGEGPLLKGSPTKSVYYVPADPAEVEREEALRPRMRLVRPAASSALLARWFLVPVALGLAEGLVATVFFGRSGWASSPGSPWHCSSSFPSARRWPTWHGRVRGRRGWRPPPLMLTSGPLPYETCRRSTYRCPWLRS